MPDLIPVMDVPARTYGAIAARGDGWILSDIEPHVAIRLKSLFPRVPKASAGPFYLRRDRMIDADVDWFLQRYPLRIAAEDREVLTQGVLQHVAMQAAMERILLPDYRPPSAAGLREGQDLRHYQQQMIDLAYTGQGLLCGDECGLGKTFEGAGFCLRPDVLPAAIVCQVHIQKQWMSVIEKFTKLRVHAIKKTRPYDLPPADIYIFRYTQLSGWVDIFAKGAFRTVIYDEPQELRRGRESQKGQAATVLSTYATWRVGLTATPIYGYGSEIFNVMEFIRPGIFGSYEDFDREYCSHGKLKDPRAVGTYLREQHAFLRRTKRDVGKEMPPVNRIVDFVDADLAAIQSVEETARNLALRATRGHFVERGQAARDLDLLVRQATGVSKAKAVARVVRILVEGGAPVILFGWHRDVYDIWLRDLQDLRPAMYTGSESSTQKVRSKDAFLAGETDLLIMSLRSAAGIDGLQARCSTVVFGELDWSPGIHHQCIERVDREGQEEPVTALFLVVDEGSDPPIMEMLGLKASEAHAVTDPSAELQAVVSDGSRIQALVDRYLHRQGKPPVVEQPDTIETATADLFHETSNEECSP